MPAVLEAPVALGTFSRGGGPQFSSVASGYRPAMPAIGTDWLAGKRLAALMPLGRLIVPAAVGPSPGEVQITPTFNGKTMQEESTSNTLLGMARLIETLSQPALLLPHDIATSGSPAGNVSRHNRSLRRGDLLEAAIAGPGYFRNVCIAETEQRHGHPRS